MARMRRTKSRINFSSYSIIRQHFLLIIILIILILANTEGKPNTSNNFKTTTNSNITASFVTARTLASEGGGEGNADADTATTKSTTTTTHEEKCTEADKCQMCTFSDQKSIPACKETGRMQKFSCFILSDEGEVQKERTEFRSCKKTEADEEFGMIRLQMLCLVIGSLAFATVRKQKRVTASLFDQRKQGITSQTQTTAAPVRGRRDSNMVTEDEEEIEFTPMTNQETVPLVLDNSNLEVI